MSRNRWTIDDSTIFDEPIRIPKGVDDAYFLRFSPPVLTLSSGIKFVSSYRDFVFRLFPNTYSAYTYYTQTRRFLNYMFYSLKIEKILDIHYRHIKQFMKHISINETSSSYSTIKLMFVKFHHDALIVKMPYPSEHSKKAAFHKVNDVGEKTIMKGMFDRTVENDVFDIIHQVLEYSQSKSLVDLRANALIAVLLYLNLKAGQAANIKVNDLFRNQNGERFLVNKKNSNNDVVKVCENATKHLKLYLSQLKPIDKQSPLFQSFSRNGILSGRKIGSRSVRVIILNFCEANNIKVFNAREITQSRRYVSIEEHSSIFDKLYE